jgi:hypothetical protein
MPAMLAFPPIPDPLEAYAARFNALFDWASQHSSAARPPCSWR